MWRRWAGGGGAFFGLKTGKKGVGGRRKGCFFGFLPCEMGLGGGFLCLFLRIFAENGGVFLRRSAHYCVFLRRSFLKGVFFSFW